VGGASGVAGATGVAVGFGSSAASGGLGVLASLGFVAGAGVWLCGSLPGSPDAAGFAAAGGRREGGLDEPPRGSAPNETKYSASTAALSLLAV
jgi:hypothetical protein